MNSFSYLFLALLSLISRSAFVSVEDLEERNLAFQLVIKSPRGHHLPSEKRDFSQVVSPRAYVPKADLKGADFSGADLSGADFSGADLRGANFSKANLSKVNFSGANLDGALLVEAVLELSCLNRASFREANLTNVFGLGVDAEHAIFDGANLKGAKFNWSNFFDTTWTDAEVTDTDLSESNFRESRFSSNKVTNSQELRATIKALKERGACVEGIEIYSADERTYESLGRMSEAISSIHTSLSKASKRGSQSKFLTRTPSGKGKPLQRSTSFYSPPKQ